MDKKEIINQIQKLESYYGNYKAKALRNYRMYTYSPSVTLDFSDTETVGYFQQGTFDIEDDTTSSIQENVIGSCIDTLVSKIASQKVRPFFNTVNGTYAEMIIVKEAQTFFDHLFEENNVNAVVTDAFKLACIFDKAVIKISSDGITNVLPWLVYTDPKEASHNKITHIAEKLPKMNGRLIKMQYGINVSTDQDYTVYEYYDLFEKLSAVYIVELDKVIIKKYDKKILPYLFLHYQNPIKGNTSQSIVDLLYGIQMQIDDLMAVIKDCIQMNPGMTLLVPRSSNIKTNMLSNRSGQIIQYDPVAGSSGNPISTVISDIISNQHIQLLDKLKNDAYELVGISQLSATSQKPSGLNSGIALSTMEDIESARFETQLNSVIRMYVDIAKACIMLFDENEEVLPESEYTSAITWKDVIKARDKMKIQFSAASALSKDPSEKLKQLTQLSQAGIIPSSHIASLMELPDIQRGFNLANNAFNAVYTFIDDCIKNGVPDTIPIYLPIEKGQLLETEILNVLCSLAIKPDVNQREINILLQLLEKLQETQMDSTTSAEMYAAQQISEQINAQLPQIQQDAYNNTLSSMLGGMEASGTANSDEINAAMADLSEENK